MNKVVNNSNQMKKIYALLNTVIIFGVIFWNYYSNTGAINGNTVGGLSDQYANLFTPAGYAFAIWGLIFLSLILLGFHQIKLAFFGGDHTETILQIGPWLLIANIANAAWLWFWLHEQTGITVFVMLVILVALLKCLVNLKMQLVPASLTQKSFVWWPIALYSGWITVATIANFSAYLAKVKWVAVLTELQWTVVMISIAALVNLWMLYTRKSVVFAGVGVWTLVAIAMRHKSNEQLLFFTAISWALILLGSIGISVLFKLRKKKVIATSVKE